MGGANEITHLTKQKPKLREAALLMRLFGVTHSPAHPCRRRHVQRGVWRDPWAPPGACPPHPTSPQADQGMAPLLSCLCFTSGEGVPHFSPFGATHQHHHPTSTEQKGKATKQNPRHKWKGNCQAPVPKAAEKGASHSVSQWCHPHCKAQVPVCYSSDCEREMRGPLRISFRFSSFFLLFSSSRSAF